MKQPSNFRFIICFCFINSSYTHTHTHTCELQFPLCAEGGIKSQCWDREERRCCFGLFFLFYLEFGTMKRNGRVFYSCVSEGPLHTQLHKCKQTGKRPLQLANRLNNCIHTSQCISAIVVYLTFWALLGRIVLLQNRPIIQLQLLLGAKLFPDVLQT